MNQQQLQLLGMLCAGDQENHSVDLLSLAAPPRTARQWVGDSGLPIRVLEGVYPMLAYLNSMLWYGGGAILCNKLKWVDRFYFPLRTPLPRRWIDRYDRIVCYYPWGHRLLRLDRAGSKVVMDLGDVMAERHQRIGTRRWISMATVDEEVVFRSGARCLAVSDEDAEEFERLYGVRPEVIRFVPPDAERLMTLADGERPARLGYMGAPSYSNEEVIRVLAQPEFLACLAGEGIELLVAGGICDTADPAILRALEKGGARIVGRVGSSLDYYSQISVTVNPIGPTTGVKIKSVETLVAGRSLLTTQYGADPALYASFPDQITYIEWPIDPGSLGRLAVRAARSARRTNAVAARAYVEKAMRELQELHSL